MSASVPKMNRRMRILIYSGNFHPEKIGIGKYTGEMARWFAARGHEVQVITGFPYYPEWRLQMPYERQSFRREHWAGVTVHRVPHYIPGGAQVGARQRILVDLTFVVASLLAWLRVFLRARRPQVVVAVCPPLFSGVLPALTRRIAGVAFVYHVQDFQVDAAVELGMLGGRLGRVLFAFERVIIKSASLASSISPAMCRRLEAKGAAASNILLLPNWADTEAIRPLPRDNAFRRELGLSAEDFVVMYAGAMGAKQGLGLVLDAAQGLKDDPACRFVMVGDGSEAEALKREAAARGLGNLRFLPLQPVERLAEMLASADVHLVLQRRGAADLVMPSKLTNILAAGRPSIATAEAGTTLAEVLADHQLGLVIPPEDAPMLIEALQTMQQNRELRHGFSAAARRYSEQFLSQDAVLARFEQQLSHLLESRRRGGAGGA